MNKIEPEIPRGERLMTVIIGDLNERNKHLPYIEPKEKEVKNDNYRK